MKCSLSSGLNKALSFPSTESFRLVFHFDQIIDSILHCSIIAQWHNVSDNFARPKQFLRHAMPFWDNNDASQNNNCKTKSLTKASLTLYWNTIIRLLQCACFFAIWTLQTLGHSWLKIWQKKKFSKEAEGEKMFSITSVA
jgi:hypothetical protein